MTLHGLEKKIQMCREYLAKTDFVRRMWEKDPTLWSKESTQTQKIRDRLGWLNAPDWLERHRKEVESFAEEVRNRGMTHVALLGMGGSSLAPQMLAATFPAKNQFPRLTVFDSTNPGELLQKKAQLDLSKTLFLVSSKSGTTIEVSSLYRYFRAELNDGARFAAITDEKTPLERLATENNFLRVFRNPSDIGGRYSALSYFGAVPAALIGIDIDRLIESAKKMAEACRRSPEENPGIRLGAFLGETQKSGADKLALCFSPEISSFGSWVEQLVAESTGKLEKGILPVDGETRMPAAKYARDRLFVVTEYARSADRTLGTWADTLEKAGHPVLRLQLEDLHDLGGEFFRWEVATAVAAVTLGIDPFDEPDVQMSKRLTGKVLAEYASSGRIEEGARLAVSDGIYVYGDPDLMPKKSMASLSSSLDTHLSRIKEGDYLAWILYLPNYGWISAAFQRIREFIGSRFRVASTVGFGPRYLHSTGQFHKGGPNRGLFIQVTAEPSEDVPIPGEAYSFGILHEAQASGDFSALVGRGRRVLRLHVTGDLKTGLNRIESILRKLEFGR
ncbi:MAG TPA: hypothetical protein VI895_05245 [Bdellovibrionota bacterium]|nr:hypothetical protein [Bdellovibrionota bacterium]